MIINTPTIGNNPEADGFKIRRKAGEYKIPVFTCIDSAKFFLRAIKLKKANIEIEPYPMDYYFN